MNTTMRSGDPGVQDENWLVLLKSLEERFHRLLTTWSESFHVETLQWVTVSELGEIAELVKKWSNQLLRPGSNPVCHKFRIGCPQQEQMDGWCIGVWRWLNGMWTGRLIGRNDQRYHQKHFRLTLLLKILSFTVSAWEQGFQMKNERFVIRRPFNSRGWVR